MSKGKKSISVVIGVLLTFAICFQFTIVAEAAVVKAWEFNADGDTEGWTSASVLGISGLDASGGYLNGNITNNDPYMISSNNLNVDITNNKVIKIKLKNNTTCDKAQIYFITNTDEVFDQAKRRDFSLIRNDSGYTEYYVDMSTITGWTGTLRQLRIDPEDGTDSGSFSIDYIRISTSDAAVTYYVSNSGGNDANSGTSSSAPWKTLAKVSSQVFKPGDKILLKRGDTWNEALYLHGSGTSASLLEVSAYGTGARPMIKRNGAKEDRTFWCRYEMYVKVSSITVRDAGMGIILFACSGSNYIDDCIAINIKGLYGTLQPEGPLWSSGFGVGGSTGNNSSITNSESLNGGACGATNMDRLYIHGAAEVGTTYAGSDYQRATNGNITRCLFDNSVYSAKLGTSAVMFKHLQAVTMDNCIIQNTPDSGSPDECGIDFEDDNQNVTIQNTVFKNNAGPAIEFLRGGDTLQVSSNVEIKNCKFIENSWAHIREDPAEIEIVDWNSPNGPDGINIHDNQYKLASGCVFFGGDGDKSRCTLFNNTQVVNPVYNHEPSVYAGADKFVPGNSAALSDAAAGDDGSYTVKWEQLSGPGEVTFDDRNAINTTAHFPSTGTYELRLVADDGTFFKTDYVTYRVGMTWEYNNDGDPQGWRVGNQVSSVSVDGGHYNAVSTGTDPYIYYGDNLNIDITDNKIVTICLKNGTSSTQARLYFITNDDQKWNEEKDKFITINANDPAYTVYTLDMSSLPGWTGTLKQLRFDPADAPGQFSIDYIRISGKNIISNPEAPVLQTAVAGDGHVNITWSEVAGSTGYKIYASTVPNLYTLPVATVTGSVYSYSVYNYDVTELANGTTYYFAVEAVNAGGDSAFSNEVSAIPQAILPEAPVLQPAVAGDEHVNITWSEVAGSTGYKVYASTVPNLYTLPVATVTGSAYGYDVTGLTNGTTYYFAVKAVNAEGDSPYSAEVSATPGTIPGAPVNVMAAAGNTQATVSFTAPLDNGGSPVTEYIVTSNPDGITARGTGTSITVTGLSNGTTYSFTVRAVNAAGSSTESEASNAVTPYVPSSEDDPEDNSTPPANMPEQKQIIPAVTGVEMLVNGNTETMGTATTAVIENKTVTTISLDDKMVEKILQNHGDNALFVLSVKNAADVIVSRSNAQTIRNMEAVGAVLEIRTENVTYTLPAAQIGIDNVLSQFGEEVELKDITVNIKVSEPPDNVIKIIEETADKNNYQIVVKPVEFEITCTSGDKTVSVSKFNGYIERMLAIPEGVDPGKITTGVVLNPDGTFSHVPTAIVKVDGKYYAKISSMTNSTYSVIWNLKNFKDVETHWAKDAVNDMGSRLVTDGVSEEIFEPERDISRAEFMTIAVKALGLMKPGTGKDVFEDVAKNAWYYDAASAAYEYGVIDGYGNGKFEPDLKITREQAMVMTARAMEIVKQKVEISDGEEDKLLENYIDADKSADYARDSIAACIKTGIVVGRTGNLIAPKDFITRAEAVTMVRRLLQKSGLIN